MSDGFVKIGIRKSRGRGLIEMHGRKVKNCRPPTIVYCRICIPISVTCMNMSIRIAARENTLISALLFFKDDMLTQRFASKVRTKNAPLFSGFTAIRCSLIKTLVITQIYIGKPLLGTSLIVPTCSNAHPACVLFFNLTTTPNSIQLVYMYGSERTFTITPNKSGESFASDLRSYRAFTVCAVQHVCPSD